MKFPAFVGSKIVRLCGRRSTPDLRVSPCGRDVICRGSTRRTGRPGITVPNINMVPNIRATAPVGPIDKFGNNKSFDPFNNNGSTTNTFIGPARSLPFWGVGIDWVIMYGEVKCCFDA